VTRFRSWYWLALIAALLVTAMIAIARGAVSVPLGAVLDALRGQGDPTAVAIVRDLRLPRVVLGALVGAGLAASGAALQGALRNPLAEPYLLGVSGGAAVGAVIAFAFGVGSDFMIAIAGFVGAIAAVFVALAVARVGGRAVRADVRTLLIAGVIVGAFANAVIMVSLANSSPNNIRGALWWMMGSAADATWQRVTWLAASTLAAGGALVYWAREIDVLALGEDAAASLGVDVERAGGVRFCSPPFSRRRPSPRLASSDLSGWWFPISRGAWDFAPTDPSSSPLPSSAPPSWWRQTSPRAPLPLPRSCPLVRSQRSSACRSSSCSCGGSRDCVLRSRGAIPGRSVERSGWGQLHQ